MVTTEFETREPVKSGKTFTLLTDELMPEFISIHIEACGFNVLHQMKLSEAALLAKAIEGAIEKAYQRAGCTDLPF